MLAFMSTSARTARSQTFRFFRLWLWLMYRAAWQPHGEHRALARLARHRHVATHHARELAGDGEPEPRAAKLLRGRPIGLAELLEQLCLLLRRQDRCGRPAPLGHRLFCKDFDDTMAKFNVREAERKKLFAIVESTKGDIVSPSVSL